MRTTRIDIAGAAAGRFARITRSFGSAFIEIEILCPGAERTCSVAALDRDEQWRAAEQLQEALDGIRGCGGDVREYFDVLTRLAD